MAVVEVSAHGDEMVVVVEIEGGNHDGASSAVVFGCFGILDGGDVVVEAVADVAAKAEPQIGDAAEIDASGTC